MLSVWRLANNDALKDEQETEIYPTLSQASSWSSSGLVTQIAAEAQLCFFQVMGVTRCSFARPLHKRAFKDRSEF